MISDLDNLSETAMIALEWSTTRVPASEAALFQQDHETTERLRSIVQTVIDAEMTGNHVIMLDLMTVMGAVSPRSHAGFLLALAQKDPGAITTAFRALSGGDEAQRFAHRSLMETLGRFARHGLLVDAMADTKVIDSVKAALTRAKGGRS